MLLYQKIEENTVLQTQLEHAHQGQSQQFALQQLLALSNLQNPSFAPTWN